MEINRCTTEFCTDDVINEINLLCNFLKYHFENSKYTSIQILNAAKKLADYIRLLEHIVEIDHYRLKRGAIIFRQVHEKDVVNTEYVRFDGCCFEVVVYL